MVPNFTKYYFPRNLPLELSVLKDSVSWILRDSLSSPFSPINFLSPLKPNYRSHGCHAKPISGIICRMSGSYGLISRAVVTHIPSF